MDATASFGSPLRHLPRVDSTNNEALRWCEEAKAPPEGAVVLADEQTHGRGRWGRHWISAPGSSLTMSIVLRPQWSDRRLGILTLAVGCACSTAIERLGLGPALLKWPNDVIVDSKKVAGILIETRLREGHPALVIVGIGVNLSEKLELPDEIAERATSLAAVARQRGAGLPPREDVFHLILDEVQRIYAELEDAPGADQVLDRVRGRTETLGTPVVLTTASGEMLEGVAEELLPDGALSLRTPTGTIPVHAAEVSTSR